MMKQKYYLVLNDQEHRLKAENQMEWVRQMNNLRSRASEIINSNLINII